MSLPPKLERFAAEAVAQGRFRDRSEVVIAAVRLLQQTETEIAAFVTSLEEAQAEGNRDGFRPSEKVCQEMDAMLEEMAHRPR